MKKILLASVLVASVCFGDESFEEHERKMKQIQTETGKGSMNQERHMHEEKKMHKEEKKYKKQNDSSSNGSNSNMRGGSKGRSGGGRH